MLKDPRWDKTPSMAGFALFVASKQPTESYNWRHCYGCAVGQYLQSIGHYTDVGQWKGEICVMNELARGRSGAEFYGLDDNSHDWTFGALSERILVHQMATA